MPRFLRCCKALKIAKARPFTWRSRTRLGDEQLNCAQPARLEGRGSSFSANNPLNQKNRRLETMERLGGTRCAGRRPWIQIDEIFNCRISEGRPVAVRRREKARPA